MPNWYGEKRAPFKRENDQEEDHPSDQGSHQIAQVIFKTQQICISDYGYMFRE